jgi:4-diphosphocytidyl-2-C-methyl-D-erythritol kinase
MTQTVRAYAKINLHLDIKGIRADGYHDVETVMQTVSLCDTVTVTLTDSSVSCECDAEGVPADEKNIAVRAARLFLDAIGSNRGAHIRIEKRIPMAAGLAGGSTDAAATLKALNMLYGEPLEESELLSLGSRLGADVPFCIRGGCAYSDGKGDILHEFSRIPEDTVIVVACGGEGVSTPWGYRLMDETYDNFKDYATKGTDALKAALDSDEPESFCGYIFNIFEAPVLRERPVAAELKQTMLDMGARAAMMSGSGPSVFGIFKDTGDAEKVAEAIKSAGYFACVCSPTE